MRTVVHIIEARRKLDAIIAKARTDLYKPIQIAEVLYHARGGTVTIDPFNRETYRNPSKHWRDAITLRLIGKKSTSSARYQDDVWNETALPPAALAVLLTANTTSNGAVERYIYRAYAERHQAVANILTMVTHSTPATFDLAQLLAAFTQNAQLRRSMDKVYESITYCLFETFITTLEATITVQIADHHAPLLDAFADLAEQLLGILPGHTDIIEQAHIYRVGVTNAADHGLDMWANFGPAIQVKHLSLNPQQAAVIVDHIESDQIVLVCRDADADVIATIVQQISWGRRVRGIVRESELIGWYDQFLRGAFAERLAQPLLTCLAASLQAEFPQASQLVAFFEERGYLRAAPDPFWDAPAP
ncbi:MAG: HaeII family restriction endonuclease [Chloroflexaceae bacterium]|nr:HaeII family restriction endonuclease [Chloroflexaceae bacterium]